MPVPSRGRLRFRRVRPGCSGPAVAFVRRRRARPRLVAFTLVELLVAIAIIGVLTALVFPVVARVRNLADEKVCTSNLRQLGMAFRMYMRDNDEERPPSLDKVVAIYAKTPAILVCTADPWGNYSYLSWGKGNLPPASWLYPQSYDYFIAPWPHADDARWRALEERGPKAGYIIDRLHGQPAPGTYRYAEAPPYVGRTVRLEMDGSVLVLDVRYPHGAGRFNAWEAMASFPGEPTPLDPRSE